MRFMGFSKSYLPVRFAALALVCAFVASLGIVALPSEAEAGRRNVWSVKFKCSTETDEIIELSSQYDDDENFFLQTIVNIHNPTDQTVKFKKKVVVALRQHILDTDSQPSDNVSSQVSETLGPNEALALDCEDIRDVFLTADNDFTQDDTREVVEGFVVIESEKGRRIPDLAVCANYFLASVKSAQEVGAEPTGASIHNLCIDPIRVRFKKSNKF